MANMTLSIRDAATDRLVRTLAKRKNVGLTEAVRLAVANELRRLDDETPSCRVAPRRHGDRL
jgi:antitoxin VapB